MTDEHEAAKHCPVIDIDYRPARPALWHYQSLNEVRELGDIVWNTTPGGFWMVNRFDPVREALQNQEVFTNRVVNAFDPDMDIELLPQNLNGEEHRKYRSVLNPWFSPANVKRLEPRLRRRCGELIDELAAAGSCDMISGFGMQFPTESFLVSIGLPVADGATLLPWVEGIFKGFFGGDPEDAAAVSASVTEYWQTAIDERVARAGDPETDFLTYLLQCEIDGVRLDPGKVLVLASTIMLAGLDTTRSALGYIFHHLATHDDHRQLLIDERERIPDAVEEFMRLYGLVIMDGRYVAQDIDFHGCPMKEGDTVWLGLCSADRDPRKFDRPDEFVIDRRLRQHLGFGAGQHRCLGAHLAREELKIALEEWHARIPHYRLGKPTEALTERGGQLTLDELVLVWDR